ncbi:MAG: substrate-binding domain-containing protein [Akkermansiaceae bacterium]
MSIALREGIRQSHWTGHLPSEKHLCREFQVSRMTLRKALEGLREEGLIQLGGRGKFHRILVLPTPGPVTTGRIVRLLTSFHQVSWASTDHLLLEGITERLSKSGLEVQIEHRPGVFSHFNATALESLYSLPNTAAWVLFHASEEIQRWFAAKGMPVVNVGVLPDDLPLACVYNDSAASGRHAANTFYGLGHRQMVFLRANLTSAGDRLCAEVFVEEALKLGAKARIVKHDGSPESVSRCMLDLISSRPRPTAFFTGANEVALSALCHLLSAGIRVPADASLISAWDDFQLSMTYPPIARYRSDGFRLGRKVAALVEELAQGKRQGGGHFAMVPEFVKTGSIGPLRKS